MKELTEEQLAWCEKHLPKGKWKINSRGSVDVEGDVRIGRWTRAEGDLGFPVPFGRVSGSFDCSENTLLKTLKGSPEECESFFCYGCTQLTTLEGGPTTVANNFDCSSCTGLKNLIGAPEVVIFLDAGRCKELETLEGVSKVISWLDLESCHALRDLTWLPEIDHNTTVWFPSYDSLPQLPPHQLEVLKRWMDGEIEWSVMRKIMRSHNLQKASHLGLF
jgi:hypothetical protein